MSWKESVARALRDLKAEEARLASELESVRSRVTSLGGLAGSKVVKAKGGKRKMSAKGRAAIARAAKKRWAKWRAGKKA